MTTRGDNLWNAMVVMACLLEFIVRATKYLPS